MNKYVEADFGGVVYERRLILDGKVYSARIWFSERDTLFLERRCIAQALRRKLKTDFWKQVHEMRKGVKK